MFLDTVMWLISVAAFLAWIFGITLKNTFATNAKHFALFLLLHLMLSGAAIMLKKHGVAGVSRDSGPWGIYQSQAVFKVLYGVCDDHNGEFFLCAYQQRCTTDDAFS